MTALLNHFLFEFRTGIRNKQLLFMNYLFPLAQSHQSNRYRPAFMLLSPTCPVESPA